MNRYEQMRQNRRNKKAEQSGKRTDILLPKNKIIKSKAKKDGAKWDEVNETHYFCSDKTDHALLKYTLVNYVQIEYDNDMNYDDRKEVDADVSEQTGELIAQKVVDGVWSTYVLICEETAETIRDLIDGGMIKR